MTQHHDATGSNEITPCQDWFARAENDGHDEGCRTYLADTAGRENERSDSSAQEVL